MSREKKLIELYKFAVKYARSFRNTFVEVDDLAHEMMLAVLKARWRDEAYATRVMRNRFLDLARRGKLEREFAVPFESAEVQNGFTSEDRRWDARLTLDLLANLLPALQARILKQFIQGRSTEEIRKRERISTKTVYRCMGRIKEELTI